MTVPLGESYENSFLTENNNCSWNRNQWLDVFLQVYALHCRDSGSEMNPRAVQAALAMQRTASGEKGIQSPIYGDLPVTFYILNAVPLGVSGVHSLVPALALLPLGTLDLSECYLGDTGTQVLADALSTSSSCVPVLQTLRLNGVGVTNAAVLACLVTASHRLSLLSLSSNKIGSQPSGLTVLCGVMRHHKVLQNVDLSDNMISGSCDVSVRAIAEWVVCAGREGILQHVDLRFNSLGFLREDLVRASAASCAKTRRLIYGFHPLVDAVLLNNTLTSFELSGNALSADVLDVIQAKLSVNRHAREAILRLHSSTV